MSFLKNLLFYSCFILSFSTYASSPAQLHQTDEPLASSSEDGIRFVCPAAQLDRLERDMTRYFTALKIAPQWVVKNRDAIHGVLRYSLNTPADEVNTLTLKARAELHIHDEWVVLPSAAGRSKKIHTVSQKEIVLALLQHGRVTEFTGAACTITALKDHVAIRQNTVAWAENLTWGWPDGDAAQWNEKYWSQGTPKAGVALHDALNDVFLNQQKYSIGCYTATKLVVIQGVLDYYRRVKKSPAQVRLIEARLSADNEPLTGIEPARMWDFEADFDPQEFNRPGKLLKIKHDVMPLNFVPGDWIYILNTDPVSYQRTGYEGSNAIYLGRNKFDDYYNDHHHAYNYVQKLNEVFQWRNGVFNRVRDAAKIQALNDADIQRLSQRPADGGLLKSIRVTPYFFAYEPLPDWQEP